MASLFRKFKRGPVVALICRNEQIYCKFYSILSGHITRKIRSTTKNFVFIRSRSFDTICDDNVVVSDFPPLEVPECPFHEIIFQNFDRWENRMAVEYVGVERKVKYSEIRRVSMAIAASLQHKFKLKKGDIQAVVLPNIPEYFSIFLAGSLTGVQSATINPLYTKHELMNLFKIINPKILYTSEHFISKNTEALKEANMNIPIVIIETAPNSGRPEGTVSFSEMAQCTNELKEVEFSPKDILALPFSSGTSGMPKAVQLSHQNINSNLIQYGSSNRLKHNPHKDQCSVLGILPWFHIYGMVVITFDALREGARIVSMPKYSLENLTNALTNHVIEVLYLVPPIIIQMGKNSALKSEHLKYVQNIVNGAAPVGQADIENILKKASHVGFCQGYGMTETSPVITLSHPDRFFKISSVGHPAPLTKIRIVDLETGENLPQFKHGEIYVKGPQVMRGYLNRPDENKNSFDEDGWFRTGDIGYYDEDRDFYISDRLKELIKVKGFQVAPAELEDFLRTHPKILAAGVIGIDHPTLGQAPKAFVKVKTGESLTEDEVKEFIKSRLSAHKQLSGGVEFVEEVPISAAGKILRKELRELQKKSSKPPPY